MNIKKLYCISKLKYEEDELFFSCANIPPPEMIHVSEKSFLTQYNFDIDNQYTIFPSFPDFKKNAYIHHTSDNNNNLSIFVKNYNFTPHQLNIIKNKYKIVGTSLTNDALMFLRYDTNDIVSLSQNQTCKCKNFGRIIDEIECIVPVPISLKKQRVRKKL